MRVGWIGASGVVCAAATVGLVGWSAVVSMFVIAFGMRD